MPKRGPYEKGAAKRAEILRAALDVFATEGYRGTSLRKVAAACNLSLPGLMHYFDSKEDLLTQVLRARDEDARARHHDYKQLSDYLQIIREGATTPGLIELFVSLASVSGDTTHPAHELFTERYHSLRTAVAQRLESGAGRTHGAEAIAGIPVHRLATLLIALADGIQLQWLADRSTDMEQPLSDLLTLLAVGHTAPPTGGSP